MATSLRSRLGELASAFAASVVDAIRGSSVEELFAQSTTGRPSLARVAPSGRRGGRLPRRSGKDIAGVIDQIVDLLRQHPKGLRAEEIRSALDFEAKEMPRPLREGLENGRFTKSGQKRATTYHLKGAKGAAGASKRGKRTGVSRRKPRATNRGPKKDAASQDTSTPAS
jgi:hypothetical protein